MKPSQIFLSALLLATKFAIAAPLEMSEYKVKFDAPTRVAMVRLCLPQAHENVRFAADSAWAMRFVSELARSGSGAVETDDGGWRAKQWRAGECLSYRADIGAIAKSDKIDVGWQMGEDLVAAPQLWLLRVDDAEGDAHIEIELPPGWAVSAPWREEQHPAVVAANSSAMPARSRGQVTSTATTQPSAAQGSTALFTIPHTPADWSAAVAIGRFTEERIALPGGVLRLTILHGGDATQRAALRKCLRQAAAARRAGAHDSDRWPRARRRAVRAVGARPGQLVAAARRSEPARGGFQR
jgi:hypothetical protein